MTKRVYIETTIPSYLAAWPSRDLLEAARQQVTHDWWNNQRQKFELCISQEVIEEAAAGDPDAARRRLAFVDSLQVLEVTDEVNAIVDALLDSQLLPQRAARDAIHIAVSSFHAVDILLTVASVRFCKSLDWH